MADSKAKQRFIDLEVDEVSLVDKPANEKPFIVTKSLEEETVTTPAAATTPAPKAPPDYTTAMAEVQALSTTITALKGLAPTPPTKDGDTQYNSNSMIEKLKAMCGTAPASLKQHLEKVIAKLAMKGKAPPFTKKPDPAVDGAKADTAKTQKDIGDGIGDPQVELIHALLTAAVSTIQKVSMLVDMEVTEMESAPVEKGLKQFSADRVAKLKEAMTTMVGLIKELDPAHLKDLGLGVVDSIDKEESKATGGKNVDGAGEKPPAPIVQPPAKAAPPPNEPDGPAQGDSSPISTSGVATAIKKALDEALGPVQKALAEVTGKLETATKDNAALQERVAKAESAVRGVTKSLPEEPTEGKPVQKGDSLFKGLV